MSLLDDTIFLFKEEKNMSDYGRCRDCQYCDSSERDGYKWYCEWYKIYVDPDKVDDCSHRKED